jgi:hypothetical protein
MVDQISAVNIAASYTAAHAKGISRHATELPPRIPLKGTAYRQRLQQPLHGVLEPTSRALGNGTNGAFSRRSPSEGFL